MNNQNKIIVVTYDNQKKVDVLATLNTLNEEIKVAKTFSTDILKKDSDIKEWKYYMDNDDLYLAFKNNALLCVHTDDNQISEGITKEEMSNSNIIPTTFDMFNTISSRYIKGITICWIDSSIIKDKRMMHEVNDFMKSSKQYDMLYFGKEDDYTTIANCIYKYLKSDLEDRKELLKEYN